MRPVIRCLCWSVLLLNFVDVVRCAEPRISLLNISNGQLPKLTRSIMFDTAEADAILSSLEVFPPDNAFNQLIDDWPLHPNSKNIIASIGADKPFRYNPDMGFVLVPPVQAILKGLKKYGMLVADNGIDWAISVAPDARIPVLHEELRKIKGADFEVVVAP